VPARYSSPDIGVAASHYIRGDIKETDPPKGGSSLKRIIALSLVILGLAAAIPAVAPAATCAVSTNCL
jgi:hypothetical protein